MGDNDWWRRQKLTMTMDETQTAGHQSYRSDAVQTQITQSKEVSNVQLAAPTQYTQSPHTPTTDEIVLPVINDEVIVNDIPLDKKISAGPDDDVDFEKKISATPVSDELTTHLTTNNSQEQNIEEHHD